MAEAEWNIILFQINKSVYYGEIAIFLHWIILIWRVIRVCIFLRNKYFTYGTI